MIASAGNIPIGVTLDPGLLFVAIKVRDITAGSPGSLVGSAIPMVEGEPGSYTAAFTGVATKLYSVKKAVYTDGTYATIDNAYPSGDDVVQVIAQSTAVQPVIMGAVFDMSAVQNNEVNLEVITNETTMEIISDEEVL